ncbi:MAG: aminodeoxychorismate lyase [Gammaproteobacteria bacterium]
MSVLINGRVHHHLAVADRGFAYGDGVFETIACLRGELLLWDRHMSRLEEGCERLGFPPPTREVLLEEARQLTGTPGHGNHVLRITVTRGEGGRGYAPPQAPSPTRVLSVHPWPYPDASSFVHGVDLMQCRTRASCNPSLAGIKHLNRLDNVLARQEVMASGADEGLMCQSSGTVVSATQSNLFLVENGVLITPDLGSAGVSGTCRAAVLDAAAVINLSVAVEAVTPERVLCADELFLTNSVAGIWPVKQALGRPLNVGPVTRSMQRALCRPWMTMYSISLDAPGVGDAP